MAKRRNFTAEFKAEVVLEALSGESSQAEVCRKPHNLSDEQLSKWKRQLLENAATLFEPTDKQSDDQSVTDQSAFDPISDAQTARRGIVPQHP